MCEGSSKRSARRTTLMAPLLCLLGASLQSIARAAASQGWVEVHKQTADAAGSPTQPSIRYGHTCNAYRGNLVVTHGYYYDRDANYATWLSDTWAMRTAAPYKWKRISTGISQGDAHSAYSAGRPPPIPCGRFGHGDAVLNDTLYMYGGHDGGFSRHNVQNYEPGYDFEELWAMSLETKKWTLLHASLPDGSSPGKRYLLAAAAVANQLLVYGGLNEGQGDVWAYDLKSTQTWTRLAADSTRQSGVSPGRRVGHSLTPVDLPNSPKGFVLFGGRWVDQGGNTGLEADSWFFDLGSRSWRALKVGSTYAPSGRKYHAEAHVHLEVPGGKRGAKQAVLVGLVVGGSTTTPGLTCTSEVWAFTLSCDATTIYWTKLPDVPAGVYDGRAAADSSALYSFGGHLCVDTKGDNPFYYLNSVNRLDLASRAGDLTKEGCKVDLAAVKQALPHIQHDKHVEL